MSGSNPGNPFSLQDELALITGGGTGIGLAIAQAMVEAGARVVIVGRRAPELQAAARALGPRASFVVHDVTELSAAPDLVERVTRDVGAPTCLVNNAGTHVKKAAVETTSEDFQQMLNTHIIGAHALTRAVVPAMMARGRGSVLFTASMASLFGIPMVAAYAAAKSGMLGLVRCYATEFSPHGVRVNAIAPGWIQRPKMSAPVRWHPIPTARTRSSAARRWRSCLGQPEDVGWAAVYLTSPAAEICHGHRALPIDGGVSIGF